MLSLSVLYKQSFFITAFFVYAVFFITAIAVSRNDGNSALRQWKFFSKLTAWAAAIFLVVMFIIHPYAFLEFKQFLRAQGSLSSQHSTGSFIEA